MAEDEVELPSGRFAADDPRARDEALKLIGLFIVNFSRYVTHLEYGLSLCFGIGDPRVTRTLWAVTSGMEENGLRRAFFAATALVAEPTEQGRKIRTALHKRAQDLGKRRNDIAHGAWYLFSSTGVETDEEVVQKESYEPKLIRDGGKLNEEPSRQIVIASRKDLKLLAQEAEDLADLVWEYISGLLIHPAGTPGVIDRLGFTDDGVLVRRNLDGWTPGGQA